MVTNLIDMKIIDFLNSKKTFNNILEILKQKGLDCKKLPDGFFIAGGSVSNIIISMLHGGEPVINDIDVYIKTTKKDVVVGDSWYPSTYTTEDNMEIMDDSYGRIFVAEGGDRMRVLSHSRDGILNIIEYVYEKVRIKKNDKSEIDVVIEGFDLNCCMSGIDLINEKLVYNKHFVDYLTNKQLKVVNPLAPIQTTIRIYKKIKD